MMRRIFARSFLFVTVFYVWAFMPLGFAAPSVRIEPPPSKVEKGRLFTFRIYCEWPQSDGEFEIVPPYPAFENLELVGHRESQETVPSESGPWVRYIFTYEFKGSEPGEGRIPSLEIRYRRPGQQDWSTLPVLPQKVAITRLFPRGLLLSLAALLGVLGAIFAASQGVKRWFSERKATRERLPKDPRQDVYAEAENSIVSFQDAGTREKLLHWSAQLRRVVATCYGIPVTATTETEILKELRLRELSSGDFREIESLFDLITKLKFSGDRITLPQIEDLKKTLLQYVRGKIIIENPVR